MSKYQPIEDLIYKEAIKNVWNFKTDTKEWFPKQIADWVIHHSTVLRVPETYISIPLLVCIAYCSQHCTVTAGDFHNEPLILYALVCGRSGTNKSASLQTVLDLVGDIENKIFRESHTFDSGTLEGLMMAMRSNDNCVMACFDEFAAFIDNLDKGNSGSS